MTYQNTNALQHPASATLLPAMPALEFLDQPEPAFASPRTPETSWPEVKQRGKTRSTKPSAVVKLLQMKEEPAEAPAAREDLQAVWGEGGKLPFTDSGLFPDLEPHDHTRPAKPPVVKGECEEDKKPGKRGHRHQCKKHRSRCPDIPVTISPMASSPATPSSKSEFQPARLFNSPDSGKKRKLDTPNSMLFSPLRSFGDNPFHSRVEMSPPQLSYSSEFVMSPMAVKQLNWGSADCAASPLQAKQYLLSPGGVSIDTFDL